MPRPGGGACDVGAIETDARIGFAQTQTIDFAALPDKTLGDLPFTVSATASSGLAVTLSSSTPIICTVSETTVTLIDVGVCTLVASQPGNETYSPAPDVTQSFTIDNTERDEQIIEVVPVFGPNVGDAPFTLDATSTAGLPVSFSSMTPLICTVNGNTITPIATGECLITAGQPGNALYHPAVPVTLTFQVTSARQSTRHLLYLPVIQQSGDHP